MKDPVVTFPNRVALRKWFLKNHETAKGVWISFVKNAPQDVLKAAEALEEALCFGWIDGQMKRVDDAVYVKYFAPRTKNSAWSAKNVAIMKKLIEAGLARNHGKAVFLNRNRKREAEGERPGNDCVASFIALIGSNRALLEGYRALSPSNQRRMAGFYFDAKQEETRKRRMKRIEQAIKEGYKGMLY